MSRIASLSLDLASALLLAGAMAHWAFGNLAHEVLGVALLAALVRHNLRKRRWYRALGRGRFDRHRIAGIALTAALLAALAVTNVTGLLVSRAVLPIGTLSDYRVIQFHWLALAPVPRRSASRHGRSQPPPTASRRGGHRRPGVAGRRGSGALVAALDAAEPRLPGCRHCAPAAPAGPRRQHRPLRHPRASFWPRIADPEARSASGAPDRSDGAPSSRSLTGHVPGRSSGQ